MFNLLVAFGRDPAKPVLATQAELAELLGVSVRQVRRYEAELEDLGAVRILRDLAGLRGGRAIELVPLVEWLPEEAWTKGPRNPENSSTGPGWELSTSDVDNSGTADTGVPRRRTCEEPESGNPPHTARARQSTYPRSDQSAREAHRATEGPMPPAMLARRLFNFLARKTGLSGKRWREGLPQLEALARELGTEAAWNEVERIVQASRSALNPGGYAFACLFPDGLPERPRGPLRALPALDEPGPLFQSLEPRRAENPASAAARATSGQDATPRTSQDENAS